MDIEEIKDILPHRYPFLLVDKVESIKEEEINAIKNVTANEPFFQGHFPQKSVMPGVLLIEAIAQTGAILILSKDKYKGKIVYLTDVNSAKFRKMVVPGDVLKITVKIISMKRDVAKCTGEIFVNGKLCTSANINCFIQ